MALARRRIVEETQDDLRSSPLLQRLVFSSKVILSLSKFALVVVALVICGFTLANYVDGDFQAIIRGVRSHSYSIAIVSAFVFGLFLRPAVAVAALSLCLFYYGLYYDIPQNIVIPAAYAVFLWVGSVGVSGSYFMGGLLHLTVAPIISILLLSLGLHSPLMLLAVGMAWGLYGLYKLQQNPDSLPRVENNSELSFLDACIFVAISVSAILYLAPGALAGDAQKGYLAWPKFHAIANQFVLTEPAWVHGGLMRGTNHTQEMFLTAGWALGENFGIKLFALLLILFKAHAFYIVAKDIFGFSRFKAKLALLSYFLIPITIEMNSIV